MATKLTKKVKRKAAVAKTKSNSKANPPAIIPGPPELWVYLCLLLREKSSVIILDIQRQKQFNGS